MMNKRGSLVVISGFSGAGKGTVIRRLVEEHGFNLSVSATTRAPREGEQDGRDYFFLSREEFEELIAKDGLIEYARYVDNYYGTPRSYVESCLEDGQVVILEIEVQGALLVKEQYPDAILIFISVPTAGTMHQRLTDRGTENEDTIRKRMERAVEEAADMPSYDYIVCNEDGKVEESAELICSIIEAERCRMERNKEFISRIREDLRKSISDTENR